MNSIAVAADERRSRPGIALRSRPQAWRGLAGLLVLVAIFEAVPRSGLVNPAFLPPFSEIVSSLVRQAGTAVFWEAIGATVRGWAIGLAIAMVAGTLIGIVIGSSRFLRNATASTIEFLRPIPSVALIPLAVLLFGTSMQATLLIVVYASFWQVLIQVLYGVQDVDPIARETARSYRFRMLTQIRMVVWPTALPYVVTGFRLAATVALVLEMTGELVMATPGLGQQITQAQSSGNIPAMYALVIVAGLFGVLVNVAARAGQARVLRWHPSIRKDLPR